MDVHAPLSLRLTHEELAQLPIGSALALKDVVLERLALSEARGPERARHCVGPVQVADGDLQIDDVLRAESRHGRGADVVDASGGRTDQLADARGDPARTPPPIAADRAP